MSFIDNLKQRLRLEEGVRNKPYKDTRGYLTIGVGRNLDGVGLRPDEIEYLLNNDVEQALYVARKLVKNFNDLSDVRKEVVVDLAFNMGEDTLSKFKNTLEALNKGDFEGTARGLEQSLWYRQVGKRSKDLVDLMRRG